MGRSLCRTHLKPMAVALSGTTNTCKRAIYASLSNTGQYTLKTPAPWYSVLAALARVKHAFLDGLDRALPDPDAALAGGIVIGGREGLGTELKDAFTRSGLVQIIVLSGYNVMIVAEWVMVFFALLLLPPDSVLRWRRGAPLVCWYCRHLCQRCAQRLWR